MDVQSYVEGLDPAAIKEILSGSSTQYTRIFTKAEDDEIPLVDYKLGCDMSGCTDDNLPQTVSGLLKALKESREYEAAKLLDNSKVWSSVPLTKEALDAEKAKAGGDSLLVVSIEQMAEAIGLHESGALNGTKPFIYDYAQAGWALIPKGKFRWKEGPFSLVTNGSVVEANDKIGFAGE